jgi:hypothetical protein
VLVYCLIGGSLARGWRAPPHMQEKHPCYQRV